MVDDTEVLVAGAGPVGLTVAHELARRGLRVRVVDAAPGPARTSRAIATHPRTLEIYDAMSVIDAILARGRQIHAFTLYKDGRRLARLDADYTTMPTRYPYTVIIEQVRTEEVLREAVARLGVEIEWGVAVEDLAQEGDRVTVTLRHAGGDERATVPWLIGCDGGHSTVRRRLGLTLIGESSETWMLADAPVSTELPPDSIYWIQSAGQALMMVPLPGDGLWRLLDTASVLRDAGPRRTADHYAGRLGAGVGHPVRVDDPEWTSVFTFQQRMVSAMRVGRCFVAGDAAHVHSPASGQGMNTGIHEAFNLAWKLAAVARGRAGDGLLDSYGAERVQIGRALLGSTRRATFLIQLKNSLAGLALPAAFAVVRNVPPVRRRIQRRILGGISGLQLSYPGSPLSLPDPSGARPRPGERVTNAIADTSDPAAIALAAELRDPHWTLVVAGGDPGAAGQYGDELSLRLLVPEVSAGGRALPDPAGTLAAALGLAPGSWLLVRPDGYVCARGQGSARAALERVLAPVPRAAAAAAEG